MFEKTYAIAVLGVLAVTLALLATQTTAESVVLNGGTLRVSALSDTLIRVEPRGPLGFENRSTFNIVGREEFSGIPIRITFEGKNGTGTWLTTRAYKIFVPPAAPSKAAATCQSGTFQQGVGPKAPIRSATFPDGVKAESAEACCSTCAADAKCTAWVYASDEDTVSEMGWCWPLASSGGGTVPAEDRVFGTVSTNSFLAQVQVYVGQDQQLAFNGTNTGNASRVAGNLLHWPSPLESASYAFSDYPRFTVPEWGPTPVPASAKVPPNTAATNGYDFNNDVSGDTYIFLLGSTLADWWSSRAEFLTLTGPTPLLPDYAYGVWYTWYTEYTESRAKDEIGNWTKVQMPLDVWGLDMNWRNIGSGASPASKGTPESIAICRHQNATGNLPDCRSHFYNHADTDLLPGLKTSADGSNEWFDYIKSMKLRTYFNDHPFPVANQTTPEEVAFRYEGLSEWIGKGLSYWWFDHNWAFTVPGPRMPYDTQGDYEGMSGAVWGSHLYYESTKAAYEQHNVTDRPITLSRDNGPNWKTGPGHNIKDQGIQSAGSPAHHRFPVWWTGDGVPLMADVGAMVEEAVHDFRSYVHSDCGGHGECPTSVPRVPGVPPPPPPENLPCMVDGQPSPSNAALLRWTAHCTLGTIVRFHQGDHRFWLRDNTTIDSARSYLNLRYKLAPSLIGWGSTVQKAGFPLTARCDLVWPEYSDANDSSQYLHLNATLVAPIEGDGHKNAPGDIPANNRSVWIPPGEWQDGWTGVITTGPKTMQITATESDGKFNIPMWHKPGSVVVTVQDGRQRIDDQDWAELTIEAFPSTTAAASEREIVEQEHSAVGGATATVVSLVTDGMGAVQINVSANVDVERAWVVRVHLRPGFQLELEAVAAVAAAISLVHIGPATCDAEFFPFAGAGTAPACKAGAVAEFRLPASSQQRTVNARMVAH